jgi:hypothetical protein
MSALTAASINQENIGSLTLHIVNFTAVTGADTYASGLGTNVVSFWATSKFNGGTTTTGNGISVSNSSGTFTFCMGTAATAATLFIVSRS